MIGCCWCTTSKCYQDKDVIEYYTGHGGVRVNDELKGSLNKYRDDDGVEMQDGVANDERRESERLAGGKLIR